MSIGAFLKKVNTRDTAVYWGVPTSAADGTATYQEPIEIPCFWKEDIRRVKDYWEKEMVSRAHVYVDFDLDERGMLYHGKLTDLSDEERTDPNKMEHAYEIRRFMKTPSLQLKTSFDRKAFI